MQQSAACTMKLRILLRISPLYTFLLYAVSHPTFCSPLHAWRAEGLVRPCHPSDARVSISCTPCSSEQSAKAKTQKELFKTLKELKMNLPPEKRSKGKSSTINTLKYALRCVKQVKGKDPLLNVHVVVNKSLLRITA